MKAKQKIVKVRNGLWRAYHGNGVISQHSMEAGAIRALQVTNGAI